MSWQQLHITLAAIDLDTLSAWLEAQGALSITLSDAGNEPILEPEPGSTPHWQQNQLTALFSKDAPLANICGTLEKQSPHLTVRRTTLADQDWERTWMDQLQPIVFGKRTWICPSWHTPPDPNAINIILDPGLAFGTGTHPTTALCLEWIDAQDIQDKMVIDYGCGSGILGIAGLKHGTKHVYAIDHDPQALTTSVENAKRNRIDLTRFTTALPNTIELPCADIILSNILANVLVDLAEPFATLLKPHSQLLLSGILEEQTELVLTAYQEKFRLIKQTQRDDWVCLYLTKGSEKEAG